MSASYNCVSLDVYVGNNTRAAVTITKMTGTCRLCLKESTKLSPIFCNTQGRKHFFDLYRKIFVCCGIDINEYDELSSFICNECVTKLNAAYDFRLLCQRSSSSYCRLQSHTSKDCICSNPNAETEIPKVKKVMKICQSTNIHGKYLERVVEEIQEEIHDSFQVNGISTINSHDNQVNGLSAKNADEQSDNSPDVSTTARPNSSTVKSSTTGVSINHESSKSSEEGNENDIDNLPYEIRLEMARQKYKDILILNKLNIPPKKTADSTKLTDFKRKGDNNNVDFGSVAGAKQKDVDDANNVKDIYDKNSQVADSNNKSINQICEANIANKNKSIDENADEQIKDTDAAVYAQPIIVGEFDHTYDLRKQIIVSFDENIPVGEKIVIQLDDNQEISAIILQDSDQGTAAEEEIEKELDSFKGFTNEEQTGAAQVDEGIEEQAINAADQRRNTKGDILDQDNYVSGKGSSLIVKDSDSSIEKPKKYFKNNPQVPNKSKIIVDRKGKSLSSRKRSRSQEFHNVSELSNVPAVKQDEFKRRKSGKTKKSSLDIVCEGLNHDASQEDSVVHSGNSIEVQAEVHVRERSPEFPESTDDALSVDYTVGIPDDDIQDSSDNTQVLVNIDNICRVCLTENANSLSIFCQNETDEKYRDLLNKIQESGGIKITEDDGLPTLICSKCINNINLAFKIRQQCQRSDTLLRLYYKKLKESNLKTIHYQEILQPELITPDISQSSQDLFNYLEIQSMDVEEVVVGQEEVPSVESAGMTDDEPPSYKLKLQLLEIGSTTSSSPITNSPNSRTKAQSKVYPEHLGAFENLAFDPLQLPSDKKYTCSICAQAFETLKILRQHRKIHKDELYVCKICPVRCAKADELAIHLKSHQLTQAAVATIQVNNYDNSKDCNDSDVVNDQQKIDHCNEQLLRDKSPDLYDYTTYRVKKSTIKGLSPDNINTNNNINSNINDTNSPIIHKCEICGQIFSKEKGLMRHRAYHESRVICDICGKVCSNQNWLESHKKLAHSGNTKSEKNTCSYCQKTFYFSAHLISHLKRVHRAFI